MPPQQRRQTIADGPTFGEILRRLEEINEGQKEFRTEVNGRFDGLADTYLRRDIFESEQRAAGQYVQGLETRLGKLEANQAWIVRIVISTVVLAVLGGLFAASKLVGG